LEHGEGEQQEGEAGERLLDRRIRGQDRKVHALSPSPAIMPESARS
jgi:hypothetical protein